MANGCDTSTTINSNRLLTLQSNGFSFVGRYINGGWKQIYIGEALLLSNSGMYIASLYQERNNQNDDFSSSTGTSQATAAISLATSLGQESGTPIYFGVDYDPSSSQWTSYISPYFNAINTIFGNPSLNPRGYVIGVYGSSLVCNRVKSNYSGSYTWLAYSSGWGWGETHTNWNIHQTSIDEGLGSGSGYVVVDRDSSSASGSGSWQHQHTYPYAWQSYTSPARHRKDCTTCGYTIYQAHTPNSTNTGCTVCGYVGRIETES